MRERVLASLCVVIVAWPTTAFAQRPPNLAFESLPFWVQLALLIGPTASALFAAIGLLLNFYQSRRTNAQARAALVAACLTRLAEDEGIQRAYYLIGYPKFEYKEGWHGIDNMRDIDNLLRHFSNIALAWQAGLLSIHDIRPIQHYMLRVVRNPEIKSYIDFVARWSKQQQLGEHPYAVLNALAEQLDSR